MNDKAEKKEIIFDDGVDQDVIDLVVARLRTMPSDAALSIGGSESVSLDDLIDDVREQNEIGLAVIKEQLEYLRSLKDLPLDDGALA